MRFYKVLATNNLKDEELPDTETVWVSTQSDAAAARQKFISDGFRRKDLETTEVDVPTSKSELLEWLNQNAR